MKEKITTGLFLSLIFGFFIFHLALPDKEVSVAERRHLAAAKAPSLSSVLDRSWMDDFEDYTLDQFPLRDGFRSVKANAMFHLFHLKDNNDLFIQDGHIIKMEYPYNQASVKNFTKKINAITGDLLQDSRVYLAVVPDKNFYVHDDHLRMDYDSLFRQLRQDTPKITWIPLDDVLSLENYYYSDLHWKQEKLSPVTARLSEKMNFDITHMPSRINTYEPFYGGYYGQAAMPFDSETLTYLTSTETDNCQVWNYEKNKYEPVYTTEKLAGMDSYDVFMTGASPLLILENPQVKNGKELILFRDSFGSSLAPLLINSYEKITLIDLRYMPVSLTEGIVDYADSDVLFLYSTTLINNSYSLK